ncbi:MAG: hypothetical protein FJ117_01080 [Deltaproteobacteria bacterium]|nr:hypothetical protein [Deltaproteobacteria bacterium]
MLDKEKNPLLKRQPSNYVVRAGGSILHDFYTGIEKIFESIAKEVDKRLPVGEEWHSELLHQMTLDIPGLRPQVITARMEKKLREYLGFRHLFRKRYGFELDWQKLKKLLLAMPQIRSSLDNEIGKFFEALNSLFQREKGV